jgi:hypothetical protein
MSETPPFNDGRTTGGRFAPGHKFSHGMKPGTRHRATMLAEKLFSADAAAIVKKVVAAAKAGEPWAAKLVIERIIPPARDRATPLMLPKMMSAADLPSALARVVDAMAEGALTPGEAAAIVATLEAFGRASVFAGHEERLARLERRLREEGPEE